MKSITEVYIYGLVNDLISAGEIINWADSLILSSDSPEVWLFDLCVCKPDENKKIISILSLADGTPDYEYINSEILKLYSRHTKPFSLYNKTELPKDFQYPSVLKEIANDGCYMYNIQIDFMDRDWSGMFSTLSYVKSVKTSFVPFAKIDDRFLCLDKQMDVYVVDIVNVEYALLGSFSQWYSDYITQAKQAVWCVYA